ncbi:MAG: histidinol dehydrogenase [Gammaproteobacteria bacterium]|jgi:histidinol dehydrogenase|nr:histidinol dehydrogenase [Gammaproteobacteria bacterium]MDP6615932.1 histidinol dehydrogenase [Gammaproteobacteria bacterium]MDP6695029.1 histidinol dehydrogenase [Gammaproteobacteria bacterium]MDP7041774.1 histidinol dehydrogenase [Gammaproteobacteria bacterium]
MKNALANRCNWNALDVQARARVLERPAVAANPDTLADVRKIIADVRANGDSALRALTKKLDGVEPDGFRVSEAEIREARATLTDEQVEALRTAIANVTAYHETQDDAPVSMETAAGVVCERIVRPVQAVGLYVPAGTAPLPSTAIMLAVPAGLAGCPVRIMCTPPRPDGKADPAVLVAASECGISEIYKLGGAQAVAAMAYGTESVPKADKIFGPGNAWVTAAKTEVAADPAGAALDMPAGPTEVLVIADSNADPRAVALDLLSQAEHGTDSQVVLVTTSEALADATDSEIAAALPGLPRRAIMEQSLQHSRVIFVEDIDAAVTVANEYAPEHLIMQVDNARDWLEQVKNAGSVFLGAWTPESVGDYCSGTNHVLPTYGYARTYSGLSVYDFQKRMSVQELTEDGLRGLQPTVSTLARLEGLDAHARAVEVRVESLDAANKKAAGS